MTILVDMDGVLCDFEGHFIEKWQEKYPDLEIYRPGERSDFNVSPTKDHHHLARDIIKSKNFYLDLHPIDGGIEAIKTMRRLGHEVFIVTSAGMDLPNAPSDKYRWVAEHIGPEWVRWLVITKSKYAVRGDVLIDDRPVIEGETEAEWEHVLFDASYNQNIDDKRRLNWSNWRDILSI